MRRNSAGAIEPISPRSGCENRDLKVLIEKVLQDPRYRERAEYFQKVISKRRGLDVAADIIEQAFQKHETKVAAALHRFQAGSGSLRGGAARESYSVAIIGVGFGGLGMAARLKESGEDSEKADGLGGTCTRTRIPDAPATSHPISIGRGSTRSRIGAACSRSEPRSENILI